ncbi:MAG: hypothetical protein R3F37_16910 [Candidatus Competibacteraceae bacterium]
MWLALGVLLSPGRRPPLIAELEGPTDNPTGSGDRHYSWLGLLGHRRGADRTSPLRIDGEEINAIPCCSVRADVETFFRNFPAPTPVIAATVLPSITAYCPLFIHTIQVDIRDCSSAYSGRTHTVTVVKPGNAEFIDQVDLTSGQRRTAGSGNTDQRLTGPRQGQPSDPIDPTPAPLGFQNTQALGLVDFLDCKTIPIPPDPLLTLKVLTPMAARHQHAEVEAP